MRIAFIGGGHMTTSLVGGLRARGAAAEDLCVSDPVVAQRERLEFDFGVRTTPANPDAIREADLVVLAVKPQDMAAAAQSIAAELATRRRIVVSIAAGIRVANLRHWLGSDTAVVRTMPNRPALIGAGITAACAGPGIDHADRAAVERVLATAGPLVWLDDESQMDVVTAVSGSGPAYVFYFIEALQNSGTALGLPAETARLLAIETFLGAARLAEASNEPVDDLRMRVTSKGGTTAAAIEVFNTEAVDAAIAKGVEAAAARGRELCDILGQD